MFGFISKSSSCILAFCFFLNTGVLIFAIQIFAWFKMSSNASADTSFSIALQEAVSGQDACEICEFVSEHNPAYLTDHAPLVKIEFPILFLNNPTYPRVVPKIKNSYHADQDDPLPNLFWGMDPPPPKVC